jgi:hypothetical protein
MAEFVFDPPLLLAPDATIRTLSEAMDYVRGCATVRRPHTQAGVLRALSAARSDDQQRLAAKGFRLWVETEGFIC